MTDRPTPLIVTVRNLGELTATLTALELPPETPVNLRVEGMAFTADEPDVFCGTVRRVRVSHYRSGAVVVLTDGSS